MTEWFQGEPSVSRFPQKTYRERWDCPEVGCAGEMIFNGMSWPMSPPGYHHTCSMCGLILAVSDRVYPRTVHEDV